MSRNIDYIFAAFLAAATPGCEFSQPSSTISAYSNPGETDSETIERIVISEISRAPKENFASFPWDFMLHREHFHLNLIWHDQLGYVDFVLSTKDVKKNGEIYIGRTEIKLNKSGRITTAAHPNEVTYDEFNQFYLDDIFSFYNAVVTAVEKRHKHHYPNGK